jgi:hypothetical protein
LPRTSPIPAASMATDQLIARDSVIRQIAFHHVVAMQSRVWF